MNATSLVTPLDHARLAVDVVVEKQGSDTVLLDIRGVSDFADYFVVTTVESTRQMRSLMNDIEQALEGGGAVLHHREGSGHSGWVLLDFGDVVIHLFGPEEREYYGIEEVWSRGVETVRIQ